VRVPSARGKPLPPEQGTVKVGPVPSVEGWRSQRDGQRIEIVAQREQSRREASTVIRPEVERPCAEQSEQAVQSRQINAAAVAEQGVGNPHHSGKPVGKRFGRPTRFAVDAFDVNR
jgi:hypothetical protein